MAVNLLIPGVATAIKVGSKLKKLYDKKIKAGQAVTAVTAGGIGGKAGKEIEEKVKSTLKNKKYGETDLLNGDDHP